MNTDGHTCYFWMYAEIFPGAQPQCKNLWSHFPRPKEVFVPVVYKFLQLNQYLLHLWHSSCAIDKLAHFWMSQLVGGDEGQQRDGLACSCRHLQDKVVLLSLRLCLQFSQRRLLELSTDATESHLQETMTSVVQCSLEFQHIAVLFRVYIFIGEKDCNVFKFELHC